nr:retrovirus-related Pol polyprotein from transposon TNT 1-94 [Tanacetum cinerariifolium]
MTTLAEFMILSGGDNHPPMLKKPLYDSWKSRMELYMQISKHGRMILESVEHGPLIWPMIEENGVTRTKKYAELVSKDLWERVKLLMQDNALDLTCRHAKRIQELLVYVRDTCPNVIKLSKKKVAITPMDKVKKVRFLRSKDEAPDAIIKCIKNIQVRLNATVRNIQTDNGTGFAEAINIAFYTQNCSLIRLHYNKTPYELMHDKKPDLSFLYVFGSLCYPTNDSEDLGKLNAKADIGIFVGYAPTKKAFRIYNRRTWKIMKTIHVTFDELTALASEQFDSRHGLQVMTHATSSPGLVTNPIPQQPFPVAIEPRAVDIADSLVSMSIDLDAPSTSIPSTKEQEQEHSLIISQEEFGGVLKNKARLVAQGFRQEVEIDFNESFTSIARIEAIRIFVENEANKNMMIFQMDVKSAFLNGSSKKRSMFLNQKDLLIRRTHRMCISSKRPCAVEPTLFTRKAGNDLLLVQIYVDDIIFAYTNTALCNEFANLMTTKFKISMMGQMSFFLGLQISQGLRGIFLNQSKYAYEIIKKYGLLTSDSVDTPMVEKNKLVEDLQGTPVDATLYRGMIGSLMYLTSSRPDLIYSVCLCARYQAKPTKKLLNAVKRIFQYLKGTINMGLYYSKDTSMSLTAYSDADHVGC